MRWAAEEKKVVRKAAKAVKENDGDQVYPLPRPARRFSVGFGGDFDRVAAVGEGRGDDETSPSHPAATLERLFFKGSLTPLHYEPDSESDG